VKVRLDIIHDYYYTVDMVLSHKQSQTLVTLNVGTLNANAIIKKIPGIFIMNFKYI